MSYKIKTLQEAEKKLGELKESRKEDVFMIAVPEDDQGQSFAVGFIKKPNRAVLSQVMSLMLSNDVVKGAEVVLHSCWLEGDDRIKEDDQFFFSAINVIDQVISFRQAIIKKK